VAAVVGVRSREPAAPPTADRATAVAANPLGDAATHHLVPGDAGYDPAPGTAVPLWPEVADEPGMAGVDAADPEAVAAAYLVDVVEPLPEPFDIVDHATVVAGDEATVEWQAPGSEPLASGAVHLRRTADEAATWFVVGASMTPTTLADIRSDGDELAFAVRNAPPPEPPMGPLTVRVEVNGEHVPMGDAPLAQVIDGPDIGEYVDLVPGEWRYLTVPVEPGDRVTIVVRHIPGQYVSASAVGIDIPPPGRGGSRP
jgi:hypothetical protein